MSSNVKIEVNTLLNISKIKLSSSEIGYLSKDNVMVFDNIIAVMNIVNSLYYLLYLPSLTNSIEYIMRFK